MSTHVREPGKSLIAFLVLSSLFAPPIAATPVFGVFTSGQAFAGNGAVSLEQAVSRLKEIDQKDQELTRAAKRILNDTSLDNATRMSKYTEVLGQSLDFVFESKKEIALLSFSIYSETIARQGSVETAMALRLSQVSGLEIAPFEDVFVQSEIPARDRTDLVLRALAKGQDAREAVLDKLSLSAAVGNYNGEKFGERFGSALSQHGLSTPELIQLFRSIEEQGPSQSQQVDPQRKKTVIARISRSMMGGISKMPATSREAALQQMIDVYGASSEMTRAQILLTLGQFESPAAVSLMLESLKSADQEVRKMALLAMNQSQVPEATEEVIRMLTEKGAQPHPAGGSWEVINDLFQKVSMDLGRSTDGGSQAQANAAKARDFVRSALKSPNVAVRGNAGMLFAKPGFSRAEVEAAINAMAKDPDSRVRDSAASVLKSVGVTKNTWKAAKALALEPDQYTAGDAKGAIEEYPGLRSGSDCGAVFGGG